MNILPLVFSFLALLTILTYTRLSGFVVSKAIHNEYEQFIHGHQEGELKGAAEKRYYSQKSGGKKGDSEGQNTPSKIKATRRLNLYPLVDKNFSYNEKLEEVRWIFKNLVKVLFSKAKFYNEALNNNPLIVDDLLEAIREASGAFYEKHKRTPLKEELPTLELNRRDLQYFFYKILKDRASFYDEEDEEALLNRGGGSIFIDLVEVDSKRRDYPIRLFLVDPPLLLAIFDNESVVEDMLRQRKNYYKEIKRNNDPGLKEALSGEFQKAFVSKLPKQISLGAVNWDISCTNPTTSSTKKGQSPLTSEVPPPPNTPSKNRPLERRTSFGT